MTEQEALARMVPPGAKRPGKYREGVIQIWVTRACDKSCFGCTQGSNLVSNRELAISAGSDSPWPTYITLDQFEQAVQSLSTYWGVVGVFGGNPATHPEFIGLCEILSKYIPFEQRGLWCNNPLTKANAEAMRATFNPAVSNLNVHLDVRAWDLFRAYWPESRPFGLHDDSRHSPPYVAMKDVLRKTCPRCEGDGKAHGTDRPFEYAGPGSYPSPCPVCGGSGQVYDEGRAWELISNCDINQHWSAMIGIFRGQLRAWFCEVAGAQAMLHQHEPDYPDTGMWVESGRKWTKESGIWTDEPWWKMPMIAFTEQVRKHCHDCGVPLRGYGQLAQSTAPAAAEQTSATHTAVYRPKRLARLIETVTSLEQLGTGRLRGRFTDYLQNAKGH